MHFSGRGILLDIEGTTSSVRFVYDVMFPYARRELTAYLRMAWDTRELAEARELIAGEAGQASWEEWSRLTHGRDAQMEVLRAEVLRVMDVDAKTTGLKQLQGLIWRAGFESGELRSHVYPDVLPALERWRQADVDLRVYSSGSVEAQQWFFGHTEQGDLRRFFSGYYDTKTGPKKAAGSYRRIAADWQLAAADILFLSDQPAELDAARDAGLQTGLCLRAENAPLPSTAAHPTLVQFEEIALRRAP